MKIGMTLCCRDEIDIIEAQLDYHLPKVDLMIVTDNGSIDGTQDILAQRQGGNLMVLRDNSLKKNQFLQVDKMVRILSAHGVEWVANVDTDEFFVGDLRGEIETAAGDNFNTFDVPWINFQPTFRDPLWAPKVPLRYLWRERRADPNSKAVHSVEGYIGISQGNHVVHMKHKKLKGQLANLSLYHYPNRGWDRWRGKIIRAGQAYEQNTTLAPIFGEHVRTAYKILKDGGEEALYNRWKKQYAGNDREIEDLGYVFDPTLALLHGETISGCLKNIDLGETNG